uniref:Uncharacterized protein n=1 Tax=Arion vulgaris TaxID=1028688 RepID=A0A0B6Z2W0_9EUPU
MSRGRITARNMGVEKEITRSVDPVWNTQFKNMPTIIGTIISKVSRSLLKRLTIRPLGVVSKKAHRTLDDIVQHSNV